MVQGDFMNHFTEITNTESLVRQPIIPIIYRLSTMIWRRSKTREKTVIVLEDMVTVGNTSRIYG